MHPLKQSDGVSLKLKIRQYSIGVATIDDIDALLNLAETAFRSTPYSSDSTFNHRKVRDVLMEVITGDQNESVILCLWKDDELVGALGATIFNPLWNSERIAIELFFHCPNSGFGLLVDAYENWARKIGCIAMQLGIDHSKRRTFKGFVASEQIYTKRLG